MSAEIELSAEYVAPGTALSGRVTLRPAEDETRQTVELSVLWVTSGKGDTDMGVVLHRVLCDGDEAAATAAHAFEVTLPLLPLSYAGALLKVQWLVRVRRRRLLGEDAVFNAPFVVGWPR